MIPLYKLGNGGMIVDVTEVEGVFLLSANTGRFTQSSRFCHKLLVIVRRPAFVNKEIRWHCIISMSESG